MTDQTKNKSRIRNRWLRVLLLAAFLSACSGGSVTVDGVKDKAVISIVNDEKISVKRFRQELKALKKKFRVGNSGQINQDQFLWLKANALSQVIHDELLKQEAKKNQLAVTQEELRQALDQAKNGYQDDSFQRFLEIEGISLEEWKNKLKDNVLIKKLINKMVNSTVSVKEEELQEYYQAHEEEFHRKDQIRALHIMVETEEEAGFILKRLESGNADFPDLARKHSLGPESVEGGDMGFFEAGQMPDELEDIFKLKIGVLSDIIRTPYGFHIFKVVEKKKHQKMNFEDSRKIIYDKLLPERQDKAFKKWLMELKEKSEIVINDEILGEIT